MKSQRPLRVAILGARGIGKVHARLFHELGAEICAVLGSSNETAGVAAQDIATSFGVDPKPFSSIDELLKVPLDAVSICTPAGLHFGQITTAFDRGLAVFCEKPLFWEEGLFREKAMKQLGVLEHHPNRKLFMNTSNTVFIDAVKDRLGDPAQITRFSFKFHTQGPHRGNNIGVDLFPHGVSLLLRLLGRRELADYSYEASDQSYQSSFMYGANCKVRFDFHEAPNGEKAFAFDVNSRSFHRIQEGQGAAYQAYIADGQTGERSRVEDPFRVAISQFCEFCRAPQRQGADGFADACANLRMMAQCLTGPRKEPSHV